MAYCLTDSAQDPGYTGELLLSDALFIGPLTDLKRVCATGPGPVRSTSQFSCSYQGISIGWLVRFPPGGAVEVWPILAQPSLCFLPRTQDVYHKNLDCQWIDITNLAPGACFSSCAILIGLRETCGLCVLAGDYYMNIELNVDRLFEELDYSNNAFNVSFSVPSPSTSIIRPAIFWWWNVFTRVLLDKGRAAMLAQAPLRYGHHGRQLRLRGPDHQRSHRGRPHRRRLLRN
jgi:hypothetical protein